MHSVMRKAITSSIDISCKPLVYNTPNHLVSYFVQRPELENTMLRKLDLLLSSNGGKHLLGSVPLKALTSMSPVAEISFGVQLRGYC
jgi:hypothetical protein